MTKKLSVEEFIEKAKEVHGDKYNYSKVEYVNNQTKVCIICPEHGEFLQTPGNHLQRRGCPICKAKKSSLRQVRPVEDFIERAKSVHGNKYDYSKVNYINSKIKVCIICSEHGEFWQTPDKHLSGNGCPKCKLDAISLALTKTTEEFISKAKSVHGDKYDYSKVNYIDADTKVCIICPKHGEFWQLPCSHLNGHGCCKCVAEKLSLSKRNTVEQFIQAAKSIHGDKYDYSKVEYVNAKTKVCIICNDCGLEFWQTPDSHLSGNGCSVCSSSKGEVIINQYLTEHSMKFESQKRFSSCKNKKSLPFDFYLPDYNLCIEYQGKQHYEPIEQFGGEESFKKQQINDAIKRNWCSLPDNPNLLEIPYTEYKDIEKILEKYLGCC